ncbi:hypothetical protein Mmc1_1177 [Magnetococcus marinus MC-1]|uniref:PHP C-terminal domain protein n=1 Tax=Magnetococcus marinus (strain ATCC BAA-1437 / JCM 17883 / MC-1) TaxID=156889 RepID=A0L6U5_MAGMM|nr:hypothetical protein [Magnetococcus marinus]ABK43688.1 hypothetical protein Mmc1_1177 [Magnetococcus marinus MC-1]
MEAASNSRAAARTTPLRGIVHAHSNHSFDGTLSYAQLRTLLLGEGLHFACMTEHIEGLDQAKVEAIIQQCHDHSDAAFLFIPGIEMDCFTIAFLGISPCAIDFTSNAQIAQSLHPHAAMLILTHPIKARFNPAPPWQQWCDGVEILNSRHDGRHGVRPQSLQLWQTIQAQRPNVVPLAALDLHRVGDLQPVIMQLPPGPLTPAWVLSQLKQGAGVPMLNGQALLKRPPMAQHLARLRIGVMDLAHHCHHWLTERGVRLPKGLKRMLRRWLEGKA